MLERLHAWPGLYTFKFIVPASKIEAVRAAAPDLPFRERRSENGRFVSLTATVRAASAEEVVDVYRAVEGITGLVSL
jgi:putative lipoic acid-binding regulatory protein